MQAGGRVGAAERSRNKVLVAQDPLCNCLPLGPQPGSAAGMRGWPVARRRRPILLSRILSLSLSLLVVVIMSRPM